MSALFRLMRSTLSLRASSHQPECLSSLRKPTPFDVPVRFSALSRGKNSKKLGLKCDPGQYVRRRNILVRQRGTKFHPGENVYMGRDHTLHARLEGIMQITRRVMWRRCLNKRGWVKTKIRRFINVFPLAPYQPRFVLSNVFLPGERNRAADPLGKDISADRLDIVNSCIRSK